MKDWLAYWIRQVSEIPYCGAGVLFVHRTDHRGLEVFLVKRRMKPHCGCWSIVGGEREPADGSNYFATACREAKEETCGGVPLERKLEGYLAVPLCAENFAHRGCHWFVFNWKTYIIPLRERPPNEVWPVTSAASFNEFSDWGWFEGQSLPQPLHPAIRKLLRLAEQTVPR